MAFYATPFFHGTCARDGRETTRDSGTLHLLPLSTPLSSPLSLPQETTRACSVRSLVLTRWRLGGRLRWLQTTGEGYWWALPTFYKPLHRRFAPWASILIIFPKTDQGSWGTHQCLCPTLRFNQILLGESTSFVVARLLPKLWRCYGYFLFFSCFT